MTTPASRGVNVRVSGKLQQFVNQQIGSDGLYESVSEYVRELIRQDYQQKEAAKWQSLFQELSAGLEADLSEFKAITAEDVIFRNTSRGK